MTPTPRRRALTALRRLVLAAFACTTAVIVLLIGVVVLSATGWSTDPHGYSIFAGTLFTMVLTPVEIGLWLLYRALRRRSTAKPHAGQQGHW
ncbi:hypothetical protein [Actinokineospora terrae]|uniref:Uncharacterized protein n=1 Tax=Actinokineospora terrae TaxID=155974 RepID=A0A1H9NVX8_9PSEU|nr:hypothetical protein [Actinokineospora terrae]SER40068.1 hypothetical protein SAMN04487818_103163 [Actinokineospora terrae]